MKYLLKNTFLGFLLTAATYSYGDTSTSSTAHKVSSFFNNFFEGLSNQKVEGVRYKLTPKEIHTIQEELISSNSSSLLQNKIAQGVWDECLSLAQQPTLSDFTKKFCYEQYNKALEQKIDIYKYNDNISKVWTDWLYTVDEDNWFNPPELQNQLKEIFPAKDNIYGFLKKIDSSLLVGNYGLSPLGIPFIIDKKNKEISLWGYRLMD